MWIYYSSSKQGEFWGQDNNMWVVHYRPDKVSQPWAILDSYDNKVNAIIKAYQVSGGTIQRGRIYLTGLESPLQMILATDRRLAIHNGHLGKSNVSHN